MSDVDEEVAIALDNAAYLLDIISNDGEWDDEAELKLNKLGKIVALLAKLFPMVGKAEEENNPQEDEEIIRRFLERNS